MAKNPYNHTELRRQQQKGDEGLLSSSGDSRKPLRTLAVPLAILVVGVVLLLFNVAGWLGPLLIAGGVVAMAIAVVTSMLGR